MNKDGLIERDYIIAMEDEMKTVPFQILMIIQATHLIMMIIIKEEDINIT
jgi:hypothetical protein